MDIEASLRQLKKWKDEGLIDAATHAAQCTKLLNTQVPAFAVAAGGSAAAVNTMAEAKQQASPLGFPTTPEEIDNAFLTKTFGPLRPRPALPSDGGDILIPPQNIAAFACP